ncbi:dihydropteroate synthase [Alcaligenaceae bacterium 429]|uniref:dihydropteroate synthase n=1 Tax=Paenalcaligenes sp. Me52 TaxID=3392038 RepID=UPI001091E2FF|nr:dihydropteroate synthase [Alcaligenaceae bacterium 429]
MNQTWLCGRFELSLERPLLMGIVNITPDSFSDGNAHYRTDLALEHAKKLIADGADILDIGGESTRPGAEPVSIEEELRRVLPIIEGLRAANIPLSVDTFKPTVMRAVLDAGADIINDVAGFRSEEALAAVQGSRCGVCVMHMQGEPKTMQQAPQYDDVLDEVRRFLMHQVQRLRTAGLRPEQIMLDPGLGFGKTVEQNYQLLRSLPQLLQEGYPALIGLSRKSMIGHVVNRPPMERVAGSLAGMLAAVRYGASVLRVHDVAASADALRVWRAVETGVIDERT